MDKSRRRTEENPTLMPSPSPSPSSSALGVEQFESRLAAHLSSLLLPSSTPAFSPDSGPGFLDFAWLCQAQSLVVETLEDLEAAMAAIEVAQPLEVEVAAAATEFLQECAKGLDICNSIRSEISGHASRRRTQIKLILDILDADDGGGIGVGQKKHCESQLRRASKVLSGYRSAVVATTDDNNSHSDTSATSAHILKRASTHLRSLNRRVRNKVEYTLLLHHRLCADLNANAILRLVCGAKAFVVLLLSTTLACLQGKPTYLPEQLDPGQRFPWCPPFRALQDKIFEEISKRTRRPDSVILLELDQVLTQAKHLSVLIDFLINLKQFPLLQTHEEEIQKSVGVLRRQHEQVIHNGFQNLDQVTGEVYRHLLSARACLANRLNQLDA